MATSQAWDRLSAPWQACLGLAWEAYRAGSIGVGAVITAPGDAVIAEGRNRWFEPDRDDGRAAGSLIAHAEVNALLAVPTGVALDRHTVWTSLEPCLLCTGAAVLAHVGTIRWLGPDPLWAGVERLPTLNAFVAQRWPARRPAEFDEFSVLAMVLAVDRFARLQPSGKVMAAHRAVEPEVARLAARLAAGGTLTECAAASMTVDEVIEALWDDLGACAAARSERRASTAPASIGEAT